MRVLFLDFDGVINNMIWLRKVANHPPTGPTAFHREFDPKNIKILNEILLVTDDLKIVISSSWRVGMSLEQLQELLTDAGFRYSDRVIDCTPCHGKGPRGHEIQAWLDSHPKVKNFVILDDDEDMAHLSSRLVRTSFRYGLRDEHISKVLEVLKK